MHDWPETKPYDAGPPALATIFGFIVFSGFYALIGLLVGWVIWGLK